MAPRPAPPPPGRLGRRGLLLQAAAALLSPAAASATTGTSAGAAPAAGSGGAPGFKPLRDLLDTPALASPLAPRSLLNGLARAGQRLLAAGQRGHLLWSDDGGRQWQQAAVPVSSDLVALHFATPQAGWAVGHDGVILASQDGGERWTRQRDGRAVPQGAETPLLDLWFAADALTGYAVGAFGQLLATRDGGARWQSIAEQAENPKALHLYAVRSIGGELYIAGEQGLLLKLERSSGRFRALALPYAGTLFGLLGHEGALLAHGLRGTVLRSSDGGRHWTLVPTGVPVGLTAGTVLADGRFVIASQAGHLLASRDDGASFQPLRVERPLPAAAVAEAGTGRLAVAGPRGVHIVPLT